MGKTKFTSVRLSEKLHTEIAEVQQVTGVPQARLFEMAWETFKKSKKYAQIVLFTGNEDNDGE